MRSSAGIKFRHTSVPLHRHDLIIVDSLSKISRPDTTFCQRSQGCVGAQNRAEPFSECAGIV
jgi:hypothetical protein